MIVEVATDDIVQPLALIGNWLVHAPPHFRLNHLEFCSHAVRSGSPFNLELARASFPADEGEAQEVEGFRFAEPAPLTTLCRKTSELDQPGLLGMQRQRKPSQPLTHLFQKEPGIDMVLEADDKVIGIAHDNHVAGGQALSPAHGPEVKGVVQVDVGEQR